LHAGGTRTDRSSSRVKYKDRLVIISINKDINWIDAGDDGFFLIGCA
jgi:hypothetical protein